MMRIGAAGWERPSWRSLIWRHPEWWSNALAVLAWALLLAEAWEQPAAVTGSHAGHAHAAASGFPWRAESTMWLLMVVAMMTPLAAAQARIVAARSLWRRRHQAIGWFLAGYLGTWLVAGSVAIGVVGASGLDRWWRAPVVTATAFVAAAAWQVTPARRRFLNACHRTIPLAPRGWRADRDCLRQGWLVGQSCLPTCGPAMLACLLAGHAPGIMAGITLVALAERSQFRPTQRRHGIVLVALGMAATMTQLSSS